VFLIVTKTTLNYYVYGQVKIYYGLAQKFSHKHTRLNETIKTLLLILAFLIAYLLKEPFTQDSYYTLIISKYGLCDFLG